MPSNWRRKMAASPGLFARHGTGALARLVLFRARAVIFATGGLGALYGVTTNPLESRGEGLGMAARAGAVIADPEFVQFHPTAIDIGRDPAPLATEALRGEGAILVNEKHERFMLPAHADAELAPRDVVARIIQRQIIAGHQTFLDCRQAIGGDFAAHFPTVYQACMSAGIDPSVERIPVAPAAHYHMGGIASDAHGRSSLPGFWVAGECAATGLHGANRLASNSLLEGLVFGARVAADVKNAMAPASTALRRRRPPIGLAATPPPHLLRAAMSSHAGMERNEGGLRQALDVIARLERAGGRRACPAQHAGGSAAGDGGRIGASGIARRALAQRFPATDARMGNRTMMTLADADRIADAGAPTPAAQSFLLHDLGFAASAIAPAGRAHRAAPPWKKIWAAPATSPAN